MANLTAQYETIREAIDSAVLDVLGSAQFILGANVKELEEEVAAACGAAYGIGVASGTDAIALSLAAIGIKPGDEVITTPFTFVATTEVIVLLGAKPVYADIDPKTFNLDPDKIEEKITERTKAILPVHLYGQMADTSRIGEIAEKHGLRVIYDGAQAIGCESQGSAVGAFGDAVTLSFFPTKNLGGGGDGGMVLTNDAEIADRVRHLRVHGSGGTYVYRYVGYCSRLDALQAAILRAKLPHLEKWNEARRANAEGYRKLLSGINVTLPCEASGSKHVYHQFTIRCSERDRLKERLAENGVDTGVYYPGPLHLEEAYRFLGYSPGDFPEAEQACREVLSLPVIPETSEAQLVHVTKSIRGFYG